ncbi:MAG TPA: polysaccharide deacetylase family protein [Spirochaetota bacterium]|nr:polysaccharide deacetylase family protein [Spirochaetota bacterium]
MIRNSFFIFLFSIFYITSVFSEIRFEPRALSEENNLIFNSLEYIGKNEMTKTLFYGNLISDKVEFEALSFYPEEIIYSDDRRIYIQNRIGLYYYDILEKKVKTIDIYPNFSKKDEYVVHRLQKSSVSPNYKYIIGKFPTSPTLSSIYLYDVDNKQILEIVKNAETTCGSFSGLWSKDSNYFIYQKNNHIYYFSVSDYKNKKLLNEDFRLIAKTNINNAFWSYDNHLVWLEENIIYKGDPGQFFYRGVYKSYLKMGEIYGKIPFNIENGFDSFLFNDISKKMLITKDGSSIYYYALANNIKQNPYLRLNDNMRFDDATLFDNGEGVIMIKILSDGKVNKKIFLIKKTNDNFNFLELSPPELKNCQIFSYSANDDKIAINSDKGSFCYDFNTTNLLWKYQDQKALKCAISGKDFYILGDKTAVLIDESKTTPLFLTSFDEAGFLNDKTAVIASNKTFILDNETKILKEEKFKKNDIYSEEKNSKYRLLSREIKKGFYSEGMYLKDLYSGIQIEVTGEPVLRYKLYQPEIKKNESYFFTPDKEKYEIGLVFNCIKSAEGIFPILTTLQDFKLSATFFINGNFIDINPAITKEISNFNFEIGNMFQYYVNLTKNAFLIDKNFIRQGLSANEEKYYNVTGKNFSPYWRSPYYSFNESIVKYGLEAGYKFVSFHLDSLDWVSENNRELDPSYYMNNALLIERILSKLKPGQIIIFNTGKNGVSRNDYLFNDIDLLISELVRSGYTFSTASDIAERYRE